MPRGKPIGDVFFEYLPLNHPQQIHPLSSPHGDEVEPICNGFLSAVAACRVVLSLDLFDDEPRFLDDHVRRIFDWNLAVFEVHSWCM